MALNISFFKTPKHRVFTYTPLYYDERKERREQVKDEALREKAMREGREWKDDRYYTGKYIRGKIQEASRNNRRHALGANANKIVGWVSMIIFFIMLIYFAKYFQAFLVSIR
ncbi:MAG TPA: hypothetical protein IAC34_00445 [Candidatus Coprenecus stercoripullorum]|nr:hypothetical protein [Candidatus Coprenecus stercoripullorum]